MKIARITDNPFRDAGPAMTLVHESEFVKVINFNFKAGQVLPVHAHDVEGELVLAVLSGEGEFLSKDSSAPARAGDTLVCPIATPHGVAARTDMRVLVTIAPPI
jgi:quercetin dioxygenase-like cupin family protein